MRCGLHRETQIHLASKCRKLAFIRRYVTKYLKALGVDTAKLHTDYTWLFNLDSNFKPLNKPAQACLRIALRVVYGHLTRLETTGAPINKTRIKRDFANHLMTRILAYQLYRRNYYLDKFNTNIPSHRPTSEVSKLAPLGDLDYDTGQLIINPNIRRLLKKAGVWVDFNRRKPRAG